VALDYIDKEIVAWHRTCIEEKLKGSIRRIWQNTDKKKPA
jgi:hypothetical protein